MSQTPHNSYDPHLGCAMPEAAEIYTLLSFASRRYEDLFQGLPVACFCFDNTGQMLEWNRSSEVLFRKDASEVIQRPVWETIGRVEDRDIFRALIRSVLTGVTYENLEWEDDDRHGEPRSFLCHTFPLHDTENQIIGGVSANIDISARKQAEKALWRNEERWQLALHGNNDGIWDWDIRSGEAFFSDRWKEMLGYGAETVGLTRDDWAARLHPEEAASVLQALDQHLARATDFYSAEYRLQCRDGSYRWFHDRGQALWNRNGEPLRVAGSLTDITDRKQAEQQLQEANQRLQALATEDGLTGLKNHRAFQERLAMEHARAPRYHLPLSVCLLDVDQFKQYNDTFGHPAGDQVLIRVAALLSESVRDTDFVARYGGEEFVLILPHTDVEGAQVVAERCRTAIEQALWPRRPVTASFGVSTLHDGITSASELIALADKALYAAKGAGRNTVIHIDNAKDVS